MTSRVLMPWWRDRTPVDGRTSEHGRMGGREATALLDWRSPALVELCEAVAPAGEEQPVLEVLRSAHRWISANVEARYSLNDLVPASQVLRRRQGSCSQRFGVLESVGRAYGVATRSRGLLVDGAFWEARFPRLGWLVPTDVVLAWPEFLVDGRWMDVGELFGSCACEGEACLFTNVGAETFFDAVGRKSLDWSGSGAGLGAWLQAELGYFASRDLLFRRYGQSLAAPFARLGDPVMRRRTVR